MKISFLTATALTALTLAAACKKKDDNPAPANPQLSGMLSAANSVPANSSPGNGTVTGTYDPNTQMLNYTLTFKDLTGPPQAAHFHYGDPKHTGDIFIPLSGLPTGTSGTITGSTKLTTVPAMPEVPATATTPLIKAKPMAVQPDSFKMGHVYANIHTAKYPAGEIRANVVVK